MNEALQRKNQDPTFGLVADMMKLFIQWYGHRNSICHEHGYLRKADLAFFKMDSEAMNGILEDLIQKLEGLWVESYSFMPRH